jgi:hypothetical protein
MRMLVSQASARLANAILCSCELIYKRLRILVARGRRCDQAVDSEIVLTALTTAAGCDQECED